LPSQSLQLGENGIHEIISSASTIRLGAKKKEMMENRIYWKQEIKLWKYFDKYNITL
jgi:hypothetical protein